MEDCESVENEIENIVFLINQFLYLYILFLFFSVTKTVVQVSM